MATYSYLETHFAFLSHTQGSALEGQKPMSNMMSWIFWDHLRPELLSPYSALYITNICRLFPHPYRILYMEQNSVDPSLVCNFVPFPPILLSDTVLLSV